MMIIIGHPWIQSNCFTKVYSIADIKKSNPNEVVVLEALVETHPLANHCQANNIPYAIMTTGIKDALFANALGAKYIICEEEDAFMIQPIAQEYLFDTRILVMIQSEKEIPKIARAGVDGVIFFEAMC